DRSSAEPRAPAPEFHGQDTPVSAKSLHRKPCSTKSFKPGGSSAEGFARTSTECGPGREGEKADAEQDQKPLCPGPHWVEDGTRGLLRVVVHVDLCIDRVSFNQVHQP